HRGDIVFESVVDEEAGGGNGTLAVIDAGFRADAALVAEPNMLQVASAQTGSYAIKITVEGKSAHGNMKYLGVSAFEKASPLINRLQALEKKWKQRSFPLLNNQVLTILQIVAGDGSITLPSTCEMLVNYTYFPDGYDYQGEITRVIQACQAEDAWFIEHPMQVELHHDCGPYYTDPTSPWPVAAAACARTILGQEVEVCGLPTGADARLYANVGHMPCIVMGPGTILCAHNPNEYIEIGEMVKAIAVYAAVIVEWCGV
ncbi:MAG: M20/M25/M40 family metallo-hydrolase, partial [Clostridia bacterium]